MIWTTSGPKPEFKFGDEAPQILWNLWNTEGNFYRNDREFPVWQVKAHRLLTWNLGVMLPRRLKLAACCLLGLDIDWWMDIDCEYGEQARWISVEDQLPEHGMRVLMRYRKGAEIEIGAWGSRDSTPELDGVWWGDQHILGSGDISHWMPLPPL